MARTLIRRDGQCSRPPPEPAEGHREGSLVKSTITARSIQGNRIHGVRQRTDRHDQLSLTALRWSSMNAAFTPCGLVRAVPERRKPAVASELQPARAGEPSSLEI